MSRKDDMVDLTVRPRMPRVDSLIPLQALDAELHRLKGVRDEKPCQLAVVEERVNHAKSVYDAIRAEIKAIKLDAAKREFSVKEFDDRIVKVTTQMNMARKNDEYQALQKEISGQRADKARVEEGLLDLMYQVEEKTKLEKVRDGEVKAVEAEYATAKKKVDAEIVEADKAIAEVEGRRREAAAAIEKDLIVLYERILKAKDDGVALAPVEINVISEDEGMITYYNCGGCSGGVTKQDANELKKGRDLIKCRACSRMLYWKSSQ
mgnify:CR=1 FL=1